MIAEYDNDEWIPITWLHCDGVTKTEMEFRLFTPEEWARIIEPLDFEYEGWSL